MPPGSIYPLHICRYRLWQRISDIAVYRTGNGNAAKWRASITINGREKAQYFSVAEYGEVKAKALAIAERQRILEQFKVAFVTQDDEATVYAETHFAELRNKIPEPKRGKWMDDNIFQKKIATINKAFQPLQLKRLYVKVRFSTRDDTLRVFVSDWQSPSRHQTKGFLTRSNPLQGSLDKAYEFVIEKISELHGSNAARSFKDQYTDLFNAENYDREAGFRLKLIENPKAKPFEWYNPQIQ